MDAEIANRMLAGGKLGTSFINGIVAEILRKGNQKISLMTAVAEYGESHFDILESLIGIIASRKHAGIEKIAEICTVDELRESVYSLYFDIYKNLKIGRTISDTISGSFDLALDGMFPVLVITEDRRVMMVHSLVWGFLKKWALVKVDNSEQKEILIHLFSIMDHAKNREVFQKTSFRQCRIFCIPWNKQIQVCSSCSETCERHSHV